MRLAQRGSPGLHSRSQGAGTPQSSRKCPPPLLLGRRLAPDSVALYRHSSHQRPLSPGYISTYNPFIIHYYVVYTTGITKYVAGMHRITEQTMCVLLSSLVVQWVAPGEMVWG